MRDRLRYSNFPGEWQPKGICFLDFGGPHFRWGGGSSLVSIENSALFDSANNEHLTRTGMSGTSTTWTASFWVQRGDNGQLGSVTAKFMFTIASDSGLAFGDNATADRWEWYDGTYGQASSRVARNPLGWDHVVVKSVAGTGEVFINNVSVLSGLTMQPADDKFAIGSYNGSSSYIDAYLAEWIFIDGTALNPSSFSEADVTGLYWTPKSSADIKALTFGTNGFYLDNVTNAETDASGNSNNFTNNNTVVLNSHTPTHQKCLWNTLRSGLVLVDGNRNFTGLTNKGVIGTIPLPNTGKWVWETTISGATTVNFTGISTATMTIDNGGSQANFTPGECHIYQSDGGFYSGNTEIDASWGGAWSSGGEVLRMEVDMDAGEMEIFIDGTTQNTLTGIDTTKIWFPGIQTTTESKLDVAAKVAAKAAEMLAVIIPLIQYRREITEQIKAAADDAAVQLILQEMSWPDDPVAPPE